MLEFLSKYFTDSSLEDFYKDLYNQIQESQIKNSFIDYHYPKLKKKNTLYKKIEEYTKGTLFYLPFINEHPEINIKRIGEVKIGENYYFKGRGAYPEGTYHLNFTVYYEKKEERI